jgi:CRP-like cAMP-binding protein
MSLEDDVELFSGLEPFRHFEREAVRLVAFSAERRTLQAGDVLFRKGERSDCGYVVLSGAVALERGDSGGRPAEIARSGHVIGVHAMLVDGERPVTALARETSIVFKVPRALVKRVLDAFPRSAASWRAAIAQEMRADASALQGVRAALDAIR